MRRDSLIVARRTTSRSNLQESGKVDPVIPASVPVHLRDQVRAYVRSASHLPVDPSRILRCACLLVAAERRPECHLPPGATISMVPYGSLAALVGLPDAESQPAVVASRYRRFRRASQQINMSAQAARRPLKKLLEVLEKHHEVLPETLRDLAEDIRRQANPL
jgi:hypothetical protein